MIAKIRRFVQVLLISLLFIGGLSAIVGGYGLISTNGLGMPQSYLEGSLFHSWVVPSIILVLIVGGTHLYAAYLMLSKSRWQYFAAAVAGFGLIIWIFGEMYITNMTHWLQIVFFVAGTAELVLVTGLLGVLPGTADKDYQSTL